MKINPYDQQGLDMSDIPDGVDYQTAIIAVAWAIAKKTHVDGYGLNDPDEQALRLTNRFLKILQAVRGETPMKKAGEE